MADSRVTNGRQQSDKWQLIYPMKGEGGERGFARDVIPVSLTFPRARTRERVRSRARTRVRAPASFSASSSSVV